MARQLLRADGLKQGNPTNLARQIYDWEKGRNYPRDWANTYAKAFKLDPSDLFSSGPGKGASLTYDPHDFEDDEVKRRALLGILATTAAAAPVTQLGYESERLRAILTGTLTTEATTRDADAWEQVVHGYSREAGFVPPQQVLPEMLADLAELDLLISRATSAARPRLVNAAAHLSVFTAISMLGLGDVRSARRWWRTATRAADESGDPELGAQVRARHSVLALVDKGNEQFALNLADQAIALAGNKPGAGLAGAHSARAQALATMGRPAEAQAALENLRQAFDRLPDSVRDDRDSVLGWSVQRLHHTAAYVHTHTGEHERARRAQDAALASYTSKSVLGPAQVEMYHASTLIQEGDTDAGAQHVMKVLEGLPAGHRKPHAVRKNAITALSQASPKEAKRPAVREAYAMLAGAAH